MGSAQTFPKLSGRVVDTANLLSPEQEAQLTAKLEGLEKQSGRQLVVATLPDLQGQDIADYGYKLGRAWGIGDKERDDGALLLVAPQERKVRIEVGYGLEGILTDALSSRIIRNNIVPRFKAGDMPGGIIAGTDTLVQLLALPPDEARKLAQQAEQEQQDEGGSPLVFFLVFFLMFFVLPAIFRRGRGRHYHSGLASTVLWGAGLGGGSHWGGGSSWGGGGGGFSGGGGSFGGGGASGDW